VYDQVQGEVRMVQVDTDQDPALAQQFHIVGIPAMVRLVNGQETGRLIGYRPEAHVMAFVRGQA
jgi:thioredoxin-like negative regulator of GroEL